MDALHIDAARPRERAQALRLALGYLDGEDLARRVAHAESLISLGELSPDGILVARRDNRPVGSVVCVLLPGAGGLMWPPFVPEGPDRHAIEDQLLATGCSWLRKNGARLAEAILSEHENPLADALLRNGFAHVTHLQYLSHDLADSPAGPQRPFRRVTFAHADARQFRETLLKTYEGTLDCPELNGVRTLDEIIAGHQGQGKFDADRWWLILSQESYEPVGVVILTDVPDLGGWDLSYVGVVPECRRQGWGRLLIQLAISAARDAEAKQLLVAVDVRNQPALDLYRHLGFIAREQRQVYLAIWSSAGQLTSTDR